MSLFSHIRREIGLSEVARLAGMNKATAYRLLTELQSAGFVEQAGNDRSYRLGPEVLRLAALREAAVPLLSVSREILDRLCGTTQETAHISIVKGTQLHALAHAYSPRHATRVMMEDSGVLSFHATSSGLAVLAFSEPAFVDQILDEPLHRFTPETVTDPNAIRDLLDQIRETGVAESVGGFEAEVHSYAAPVFGQDQKPMGGLAVAAPVSRMSDALRACISTQISLCAIDLTRKIGGFCPPEYPLEQAE
jgi:DNA-binding IclR family transcriptional regulator